MYADYGFGRDEAFRHNVSVASVGAGADLHIGAYAVGSVDISCPLIDASITRAGDIHIDALLASQFANVPALGNPDQITLDEEERVAAYFGGGLLYATPDRTEPYL